LSSAVCGTDAEAAHAVARLAYALAMWIIEQSCSGWRAGDIGNGEGSGRGDRQYVRLENF